MIRRFSKEKNESRKILNYSKKNNRAYFVFLNDTFEAMQARNLLREIVESVGYEIDYENKRKHINQK